MAEITLRDLCRWDRRLQLVPPVNAALDDSLDRGVSWVVSVRTSPPLLPPVRGEELVVIPRRILTEIEDAQLITREQLLDSLERQRISAILTEPGFSEEPLDHLPLITLPSPFPQDAEGTFNRLLTERRAELYRLGNDLSRRLSQAAMDPRGVEGILDVAAELAGHPVVLQDADAQIIARVGQDDEEPAGFDELQTARGDNTPSTIRISASKERLIVPMSTERGPVAYLSITAPSGTLTEVDRLVLTQTAGTAEIVLAQGNALGARGARNQSIAELLEGRLASDTAAIARARGLGIEPSRPMRVGVITTRTDGLDAARRVADQLLGGLRTAERAEVGNEVLFLVANSELDEFNQRLSRMSARELPSRPLVTLGHPIGGIAEAPHALREARFARGLVDAGVISGTVIRADSLNDIGVFGLLYHLWGNPAVSRFRQDVLGALEEYDRRRGTELVETLRAYLSSGGSVAESAASLNIHRNTLSYRISRIAELSGRDLNSPDDRLLLRVALLCRDLVQVEES
jgi:PucR family transcriptional regulator, purine catabolism regulatory protein